MVWLGPMEAARRSAARARRVVAEQRLDVEHAQRLRDVVVVCSVVRFAWRMNLKLFSRIWAMR